MTLIDENIVHLENQLGFETFKHEYRAAIKTVRTKIEILSEDFAVRNDYNPIHHIERRLKTPESIEEKLTKLGCEISIQSARENIFDIAGIRVVCNFIDDVYTVADMLSSQDDIHVMNVKDYIKNPKANGYSSLHMIIGVPVFLLDRLEEVPVELQIRTVAMDFWASLEHELRYKHAKEFTDSVNNDLKDVAETTRVLDKKMQKLFDEVAELPGLEIGEDQIFKPRTKQLFKEIKVK